MSKWTCVLPTHPTPRAPAPLPRPPSPTLGVGVLVEHTSIWTCVHGAVIWTQVHLDVQLNLHCPFGRSIGWVVRPLHGQTSKWTCVHPIPLSQGPHPALPPPTPNPWGEGVRCTHVHLDVCSWSCCMTTHAFGCLFGRDNHTMPLTINYDAHRTLAPAKATAIPISIKYADTIPEWDDPGSWIVLVSGSWILHPWPSSRILAPPSNTSDVGTRILGRGYGDPGSCRDPRSWKQDSGSTMHVFIGEYSWLIGSCIS